MSKKTHFGFDEVDLDAKAGKVATVFHSVAGKYDLMNDFMSMGIHRVWKNYTVATSAVAAGDVVLDLAAGTGDLALKFSKKVGTTGQVVLADINSSMLEAGRSRMIDAGAANNMRFVQADAQQLPFAANSFDLVSIAFGLRNVTDKERALASIYRVLKPGGRLLVLEFSKPQTALMRKLYDQYSFKIIPKLGKLLANDEASYQYLVESIRMHPDQKQLASMMSGAGFDEVDYTNMSNGIVALHRGFKW